MTIALKTLEGATEPGIVDGGGTCTFAWDGFGWVLITDACESGKPVEPTFDGTEIAETAPGTCKLRGEVPFEATVYTLLEDPDGLVGEYIEKYHTQSLSRLLCENAAVVVNRGNKTIIHNYANMPSPRINQLIIPTGATRWSYCLLLADDDLKEQIYHACDDGESQMNLIFSTPVGDEDEEKNTIRLTVWCLPPRRVSPDTTDEEVVNLWIIPVVDDRYWWQYRHVDKLSEKIEEDGISSALDLQDELIDMTAGYGGSGYLNVNPNAVYDLLPSFAKLNDYENLPIMIDTANTHAGQRLVIDIKNTDTGTTRFATISGIDSIDTFDWNLEGKIGLPEGTTDVGKPYLVAGGKSMPAGDYPDTKRYASIPESVDIQTTEGEYTNKTAAEASSDYKFVPDVKAVWRTCYDEEPSEELIEQANKDYYYQFAYQYDFTFAGVQPWQQGYFDDYMVLTQNWNPKTKGYSTFTRVCSRPPNLQGEWAQAATGGSGERDCWAIVDEVVCDPYGDPLEMYVWAIVKWFTGDDCKAKIPGADPYTGMIKIEQVCDIFTAYYTAEQLVGKLVRATYMFPQPEPNADPIDPCEAKWLVDTVCGAPECS